MVFKKIKGISLSDFSSIRRDSVQSYNTDNEHNQEEEEAVEEAVDVITDNLGFIGRLIFFKNLFRDFVT